MINFYGQSTCIRCGKKLTEKDLVGYVPKFCCPPNEPYDIRCGCENRPLNPIICNDCEIEIEGE